MADYTWQSQFVNLGPHTTVADAVKLTSDADDAQRLQRQRLRQLPVEHGQVQRRPLVLVDAGDSLARAAEVSVGGSQQLDEALAVLFTMCSQLQSAPR